MRYSLRTLLIVMLLAGPLLAYGWTKWTAYVEWKAREEAKRHLEEIPYIAGLFRRSGTLPKFRETPEETAEYERNHPTRQ